MILSLMILIVCTALPVLLANAGLQGLLPLVLAMILIKAWLVVDRFMELRHAPRHWRWAVQAWAPMVVLAVIVAGGW
ncbi:cytochrome C oxidase subunit IV family protein [Marinobacter xestospongiae]|uniref:Cytochrome C oxidase subunit IV family protein n=1 Tax=Marinobacter xestospongiae TaxID=994319 RepID=A0ABU3W160_9GAMM|nr:cytochrome C oxidase subunit IV family protein [Marinobacter xestospongiae]MDV2080090.1 cytochrome C oxidase subunit IV family protein [Marinobacter xestospongiae]